MSHRARIRRAWTRWGKRHGKEGIEQCAWKCTPRRFYQALAQNYRYPRYAVLHAAIKKASKT